MYFNELGYTKEKECEENRQELILEHLASNVFNSQIHGTKPTLQCEP